MADHAAVRIRESTKCQSNSTQYSLLVHCESAWINASQPWCLCFFLGPPSMACRNLTSGSLLLCVRRLEARHTASREKSKMNALLLPVGSRAILWVHSPQIRSNEYRRCNWHELAAKQTLKTKKNITSPMIFALALAQWSGSVRVSVRQLLDNFLTCNLPLNFCCHPFSRLATLVCLLGHPEQNCASSKIENFA